MSPSHATKRVADRPRARLPLLNVEEVADRLNVSVAYVRRRLIFERRVPYFKVGGKVRVAEADLEEWLEAGRVPAANYSSRRGSGGRRRGMPVTRGRD